MPRLLQGGFTLIELIATLSVLAVLSAVALPQLSRLHWSIRAETDVQRLHSALAHARYLAATTGRPVTLCPTDPNGRCNGDWQGSIQVFVDDFPKGHRDPHDDLLREYHGPHKGSRLRFRAFRTSRYLRFLPNGQTDWQNGRFRYCPPPNVGRGPTELVVNVQGRTRIANLPTGQQC
jgi:type IV fimbrial biogenesis protein FimT